MRRETREEREQLVKQKPDEEGLPPEYGDIETSDTEDPLPVEEELLNDNQTYKKHGRTICNVRTG